MKKSLLVVIGNGVAGVRALEELLRIAPPISTTSPSSARNRTPNCNHILLSPVLAGGQTIDQIVLDPLAWYANKGIRLHPSKSVSEIDRVKRRVIASECRGGEISAAYDRVLIATGSTPSSCRCLARTCRA